MLLCMNWDSVTLCVFEKLCGPHDLSRTPLCVITQLVIGSRQNFVAISKETEEYFWKFSEVDFLAQ